MEHIHTQIQNSQTTCNHRTLWIGVVYAITIAVVLAVVSKWYGDREGELQAA